jgi:energy-coupling factor transporter transmembrane protein EcfT
VVLQWLLLLVVLLVEFYISAKTRWWIALLWHFLILLTLIVPLCLTASSCRRWCRPFSLVRLTSRKDREFTRQSVPDGHGGTEIAEITTYSFRSSLGCRYCGAKFDRSWDFSLNSKPFTDAVKRALAFASLGPPQFLLFVICVLLVAVPGVVTGLFVFLAIRYKRARARLMPSH